MSTRGWLRLAVLGLLAALAGLGYRYWSITPEQSFGKTLRFSTTLGTWSQWPASWEALAKQAKGKALGVAIPEALLAKLTPLKVGDKVQVLDGASLQDDTVSGFWIRDATDYKFHPELPRLTFTFLTAQKHSAQAVYLLPGFNSARFAPRTLIAKAMDGAALSRHWFEFEGDWGKSTEHIPSSFDDPRMDCLNIRGDEGVEGSGFRGYSPHSHCLKEMLTPLMILEGRAQKKGRWAGWVLPELRFEFFDTGGDWRSVRLGERRFYSDEIRFEGAFQLGDSQFLRFSRAPRGTPYAQAFLMKCRKGRCEELAFSLN